MRREDAVLGVVVRLALRDEPVVRAEEEDAVAVEAVDREAAHDGDEQRRRGMHREPPSRRGMTNARTLPLSDPLRQERRCMVVQVRSVLPSACAPAATPSPTRWDGAASPR